MGPSRESARAPHIPFDCHGEPSIACWQERGGVQVMASELEDRIIGDFARDIAGRLGEAAAIARTADA